MGDVNPMVTVLQIAGGYVLPRCLHVVADLGVADVLEESPRTAEELAASVGADPDALGRVLRFLSAYGLFESQDNAFRHSPASRLLRTDHPQSMRAVVRMFGLPINWAICGALEESVRAGIPATTKVLPEGHWDYFAEHPEENRIFNEAMKGKAHGQVAGVVAAYDFSEFDTIGDIGGGHGHLLKAVLDAAPNASGVLFDLPHVIEEVAGTASKRLSLRAGDFFKDPLPTCDAYLLMEVIHDWGDEQAIAILKAVRSAVQPHAKVLLIEQLIPPTPGPDWAKTLDIHMLFLLGGRQRTRAEYEDLFDKAGFKMEREIDTAGGISILEAIPA
ncbi:MAG TPA: methyltransferase [Gemmatimonadota bacterium]|nr:methyltransferase [Gemmatimonadota bacterium]